LLHCRRYFAANEVGIEKIMSPAISARLNAHDSSYWEPAGTDARAPSMAVARSQIALSVHDDLAAIEAEWGRFEQHADCTVFQTFGWLSTWQQHIGARNGVRPAIVVGRDTAGDIVFMLPLSTRSTGFARELTWLGSELGDYNAPLLARDFSNRIDTAQFTQLWRAIAQRLQAAPQLSYDLVRFEKMPATVGGQANPMLALGVTLNPSGAYATPLGERWDTFYTAKRSANTRRRDRNKRNRLAEAGAVKLVTPESASAVLETLSTLMEQKARAFARMGVANLFARPGYSDFYRAIATDLRTRHLVHVSQLEVGSQVAAANIGLTFRDTYYHLQASYLDGEFARFGPGAAHLHDLLRYAIERGFKEFDFTIGDERYKLDWCDGANPLYDHISVATWRGALVVAPVIVLRKLKRRIKQTPWLWNAYSKGRAWAGSLMTPAGK